MDQDTMLTTLVAMFQTARPRTRRFELVTKALATWEDAVYSRPFSHLIKHTPREHVLPAPQDLGCWGPHADSHIL
jgi:hypothetical protein